MKLREKVKNHMKDAALMAVGAVVLTILEYQKLLDKLKGRK